MRPLRPARNAHFYEAARAKSPLTWGAARETAVHTTFPGETATHTKRVGETRTHTTRAGDTNTHTTRLREKLTHTSA